MILLAIGLILAYTSSYHTVDNDNIIELVALGVIELVPELLLAAYLLAKAIGVI